MDPARRWTALSRCRDGVASDKFSSDTEIIEQLSSYLISSISIEIEEVTQNFRFMHKYCFNMVNGTYLLSFEVGIKKN